MFSSQFKSEALVRYNKIFKALQASDADALLLNTNVNIYYAAGQIFSGYIYIDKSGNMLYFVKRPVGLKGEPVVYIRKPEEIPAILQEAEIPLPSRIALELDYTSYNDIVRLSKVFNNAEIANGSAIMRQVRATKTPYEIERLKESATRHEAAYSHIEAMYEEGMTDFELQIEIERRLRMEGCLGIFRVAGPSMEVFMGSLLSGDNADTPSPYDFALGGAGLDPSLPVGCNGTLIRQGSTVMVDLCGNFTGYMTDMSRTFSVGQIPELAHRAHATTAGVASYLPAYCGYLIQKEISIMGKALEDPARPFVAILGGAKVSDKLNVINNLLTKVDTLIIGGGMAYTFLAAKGYTVGTSLLDTEKVE